MVPKSLWSEVSWVRSVLTPSSFIILFESQQPLFCHSSPRLWNELPKELLQNANLLMMSLCHHHLIFHQFIIITTFTMHHSICIPFQTQHLPFP